MIKSCVSRRVFLGTSFIFGSGAFYWMRNSNSKVYLYANETQVLLHAAYHLFPPSPLGPSAKELHIASYLAFVLEDKRIMKRDRDYFLKGAYWLEESAFEEYGASFINLNQEDKEELLLKVSQDRWGRNFIYTSLGYIFEALLSAPIYGSNPKQIGWKWLEHNPGFPQPKFTQEITYEV
ncbi:gluconate 2-dehydrogenase subunit 3 family protein [Sulfurimonas sp. MAG313]|nr:gluconate 2-dehydrogenase subunit 3 family protein [Sulfurimonas sp. MAG313]MDF1880458.1 gluconate 2-dehydrogenase subunit 3 family protein [Sulfurimonas sp. MAG313]